MNTHQVTYIVFGGVLLLALAFDLGLLSKKNTTVTIKTALIQTLFWVLLALGFFVFMLLEQGQKPALEYLSAYLMEWSLSIDNIFVFILIFTAFGVKEKFYGRVLLVGILMAIVFRVAFITVGVAAVQKWDWLLYIFGVFLVYTGYSMFKEEDSQSFDLEKNKAYRIIKKIFPLTSHDGDGKWTVRENGKRLFTTLSAVILVIASVDLVFALDSIPAVMGISRDKTVIYTSNIFAVLGLRSLFFLLRGAVNKFAYLQQGIAIVLIFIGLKMLGEHYISLWLDTTMQTILSLAVIVLCIAGSMWYSVWKNKKQTS